MSRRADTLIESRFYHPDGAETIRCELCPHRCVIAPGTTGFCGVRKNYGGELQLPYYGAVSALAVDPIEKKPLYHFYPGSDILSVGFLGCNLRCPYCQNFRISHGTTAQSRTMSPSALVSAALDCGSFGIAYTYNEPTIHIEYLLEVATAARKNGIKNVLVTAGNLNTEPARELLALMDAVNLDLKSFDNEYYRRTLRADLSAVLEFARLTAERCHLEVTTLLVPGATDTEEEVHRIAQFVSDIDRSIPLHLSAYHPTPGYQTPPTPASTVHARAATARRYLYYVYTGNLGERAETCCPGCGAILIRRMGLGARVLGLTPEGSCAGCGRRAEIVVRDD